MKEATGDMTMTIVVIVGAIAILAIAPRIWDVIAGKINEEVGNIHAPINPEDGDGDGDLGYLEIIDNYYN